MKFKAQKRQNQLIERISTQHLIVGIDIAQETHVARAVNFRGIILGEPLSFPNREDGFHSLLQWIQHLQSSYNLTKIVVGMEPTGHYWLNVSRWLSSRDCEVVLVNPHLVKKNKENRDNTPSKSYIMSLSKRGRPRLRRFIFITTMSLVMNNPEFQALHHNNVHHKKMKKMKSIMKLCGKLARLLIGMARSGESYNPNKALPIAV